MAVLQTARLTLRPCSPDDCADFMALELDPEVMRYLNGGHAVDHAPVDPAQIDTAQIDPAQTDPDAPFLMPRGTEPYVWTARRTADGAFVGWFCLWPESEGLAELGYRLRRTAWGQGLASEGAAALVAWGFDSAGYDRITACTMTVNMGSRRVMEKLGMRHDRTVPYDFAPFPGSEQGEVWYELTRAAWNDAARRVLDGVHP